MRALERPDRLRDRVERLERLEAYGEAIDDRGRALRARLEAANAELYRTIREEIQRGAGPDVLLRWVNKSSVPSGEGYDYLDELVLGVLQFEEPDDVVTLDAEMVFYQPTPARHIFDLFGRTALTERDVLVDLGSGLGQVALLTAICTRARAIGIEIGSAYVDCARQSARGLKLANVTFIQQDARMADLSVGTVFYLYTPFKGTILRAVLDSLRREAGKRPIRVCTYGPCTLIVGAEAWLDMAGPLTTDRVAIFHSHAVS